MLCALPRIYKINRRFGFFRAADRFADSTCRASPLRASRSLTLSAAGAPASVTRTSHTGHICAHSPE